MRGVAKILWNLGRASQARTLGPGSPLIPSSFQTEGPFELKKRNKQLLRRRGPLRGGPARRLPSTTSEGPPADGVGAEAFDLSRSHPKYPSEVAPEVLVKKKRKTLTEIRSIASRNKEKKNKNVGFVWCKNKPRFSVTNHRVQFALIMRLLSSAAVNTLNAAASVSGGSLFIVKADECPESPVSTSLWERALYCNTSEHLI